MLRQGCAIILFVLLILPSMCLFQIIAGINSFAFDSTFYTSFIDSPLLYNSLADGMGVDRELVTAMPDGPVRDTLLSASDPATIRQTVLAIANDIVNAIMNGEESILITMDISSWREFLVSNPPATQIEFLQSSIDGAPDCAVDQPMTIEGYPIPVCIPEDTSREQWKAYVVEERENIVATYPNAIAYNLDLGLEGSEIEFLQIRESLQGTITIVGIFSITMWFVTAFIFDKKVSKRFRWLGVTLLIPSALMIVASILFSQTILSILGQATVEAGSVDAEVISVVGTGLSRIWWSFFFAGAIPAVIGFFLYFVGGRVRARDLSKRKNEFDELKKKHRPDEV